MSDEQLRERRLAWFNGNEAALEFYLMLIDMSHTWDDLIDNDVVVSGEDINRAFTIPLLYLPANPFYASIQSAVLPMWMMVVSAYETANYFERNKDKHGIEISHSLRYTAGHIVAYAVHVCHRNNPPKEMLAEMWKDVFYDRFDEYRAEHLQ